VLAFAGFSCCSEEVPPYISILGTLSRHVWRFENTANKLGAESYWELRSHQNAASNPMWHSNTVAAHQLIHIIDVDDAQASPGWADVTNHRPHIHSLELCLRHDSKPWILSVSCVTGVGCAVCAWSWTNRPLISDFETFSIILWNSWFVQDTW